VGSLAEKVLQEINKKIDRPASRITYSPTRAEKLESIDHIREEYSPKASKM